MKTYTTTVFVLLAALMVPVAQAQQAVLAEIDGLDANEVEAKGFVLDRTQEIRIEARVPLRRSGGELAADLWVLDARTRNVVWSAADAARNTRDRDVLRFTETLSLPAGPYEVYYSTFIQWGNSSQDRWRNTQNLGDIIRNVIDEVFDDHDGRSDVYYGDASVVVRGHSGKDQPNFERLADDFLAPAFLTLTSPQDNFYVHQGFVVKRPTDIEVYAIGEMERDEAYDYGWIINTATRERVWTMRYRNTRPGGGAMKNRMARETIRLDEGHYAAFFVTDGSHSAREWDAAPPYDPDFWGLTLRVQDEASRRDVALEDYRDDNLEHAIVALRNLGDDVRRKQGFTLAEPMAVRVYAVGEGSNGDMYDYGWIENAETYARVWTMDYYDTEHAGGAQKNRLYDGIVHLPAGKYIAGFETDYAHAAGDWNAAAPYDREAWGITISPAGTDYNPAAITTFSTTVPDTDASALVHITRVRNDVHERARFTLDKDSRVRIYAMGEGSDNQMYDYGWIEDANTGEVIWEMTYRMTDHAGGDRKNRMLNRVFLLPAGDYVVHYRTDDSHAYGRWNTDAPRDPERWGITIRIAEN